ncbi:uncharacterized protein BO72DRAFT_70389 [Aspergillus fijiensis CBS 313.89]|uniref:Uncharacterized protein n=1 Tax=Aspergillus fijiensis CBS 313.89 TaxID=1448319 RepID=A0A8G1RTU0_9EURO|nr:uncharacterized protein BO72DRAFT_70389 [Aspergillus fijiensis CBS 313.89]RAK78749.1 hypothetical protein BO72DRAFT_70389 [Aspergillus fijiensis CBS 313.89]
MSTVSVPLFLSSFFFSYYVIFASRNSTSPETRQLGSFWLLEPSPGTYCPVDMATSVIKLRAQGRALAVRNRLGLLFFFSFSSKKD